MVAAFYRCLQAYCVRISGARTFTKGFFGETLEGYEVTLLHRYLIGLLIWDSGLIRYYLQSIYD